MSLKTKEFMLRIRLNKSDDENDTLTLERCFGGAAIYRNKFSFPKKTQDDILTSLETALEQSEEPDITKLGKKLFSIFSEGKPISFNQFFGRKADFATLNVAERSRLFPWEIMCDNVDFFCTHYAVGRTVVLKRFHRYSGRNVGNERALVVVPHYSGHRGLPRSKEEGEQVHSILSDAGYSTDILEAEEATWSKLKNKISRPLAIFHFTIKWKGLQTGLVLRFFRLCCTYKFKLTLYMRFKCQQALSLKQEALIL